MKKKILTFFVFYSSFVFAQKNITGTLIDSLKNDGVPFASIGLLSLPDSVIVKGTITDETGNFKLDELKIGNYALRISAVGYLDKTVGNIHLDSSSSQKISLQIKLSTSSHTFNEVAVTAIKRTVEFKNNNITVNVEDSPLAKGNSVFDLLSKVPGVSIEGDEIKIQGKSGVVVMIDDRPQNLSVPQLANLLRGMPADLVKRIELLKNPPVKYDASGTSGMINIVTKKTTIFGFTGTVFSSYSQGFYPNAILGGSLNYKSKKLTIYSNISGDYNKMRGVESFKKRFGENNSFSYLDGKSTLCPFSKVLNGKIGLDFNVNATSVLGVKVVNDLGVYEFNSGGRNYLTGDSTTMFDYLGATSYLYDRWNQTDISMDYSHNLDTAGSNFSLIMDYTLLPEYVFGETHNRYYDDTGNEVQVADSYHNFDRSTSNLFSGRANLTKKIDTTSSLETGIKFSQAKTMNDFLFERDVDDNGVYVKDQDLSNKYRYRELTYAGYVNYNKIIKKVSMQLGVRIENTYLNGSSDKQFSLKKKYLQVFPNISFEYKRTANHDFQLSLNRRINRPDFFSLNPVRQYRDKYYYQQGNPGLTPEFANKAELSYNYKGQFSTALAYTYNEHVLLGYTRQVDTAKLTIESKKNMKYRSSFEWSIFYQRTLIKKWDVSFNGSVQYLKYEGEIDGAVFQNKGFGSSANLNNVIIIGKNMKLEVGATFFGPMVYGIVQRGVVLSANAALKISMLKDKIDLSIGGDDLFHTLKWETRARLETQNWDYHRTSDSRRFRISLNYKFGKIKIEQRQVSADEDKERLSH